MKSPASEKEIAKVRRLWITFLELKVEIATIAAIRQNGERPKKATKFIEFRGVQDKSQNGVKAWGGRVSEHRSKKVRISRQKRSSRGSAR